MKYVFFFIPMLACIEIVSYACLCLLAMCFCYDLCTKWRP